jgi:hypothetical protein
LTKISKLDKINYSFKIIMTHLNPLNLMVVSPRDKVPEGYTVINTTSKSREDFGRNFSPFYLSNIDLYEGMKAKNMENAWHFAKVYKEFTDNQTNPTLEYFKWAKKGWDDSFAHRYANGKGNVPLYSFWKTFDESTQSWQEHKWDYITARKNIYFPLYAKAIINTSAFKELQKRVNSGEKIALWDFDGYDHEARNMTYQDVVHNSKYKCGHAFVLYGLLTQELIIKNGELIFNFKNNLAPINQNNTNINIYNDIYPSFFNYKDYSFISAKQFMIFSQAKTFNDEQKASQILNIFNEFRIEAGIFKDEEQKLCFQLASAFQNNQIKVEKFLANETYMSAWINIHQKMDELAQEIKNYDSLVWSEKETKVKMVALREKFNQNETLKSQLLNDENVDELFFQLKNYFITKDKKLHDNNNDNPSRIEVLNYYTLKKIIPENGVYIGRSNKGHGLVGSMFANPFAMKNQTDEERERVISEYKKWIWQELLEQRIKKEDLLALKDKNLVCYCAPKDCHGHVLKELINYILNNENEFDEKIKNHQHKKLKM